MSLGPPRRRFLALICLSLLIGGVSWRWATVLHGGDYRYSWGRIGYSDIVNLYVLRDFAAHAFPYLRQPVEYPVLTGLTMWVTSYAPAGLDGYFLLNATALAIAGLATFFVLGRFVGAGRLARYALAPGLFLYGALNWDLLSLLALSLGLFAAARRRFAWCGLWIGIGASYKLYPAFVLPVLAALALRVDRDGPGSPRALLALLGTFVTTTLVCNLPLAIVSPSGWSYFLRFQASRSLDPDAIWSHLPPQPLPAITRAFVFAVLVGAAWMAVRVYLNRGQGWQPASLVCLLLFLVVTRDYSPQYDVWPLPLLAILGCPWPLWIVFVVADLTYYVAIFLFLLPTFGWPPALAHPEFALGVGVWSREAALLLLLVWALRGVLYAPNDSGGGNRSNATVAVAAAVLAVLVAVAGGVAGLASTGVSWREIALELEAGGLVVAASVAIYRYTRFHSNDGFLFAAACLIPYFGVVVVNFGGIGSFLLSGLLLSCVALAESRVAVVRRGDPPVDRAEPMLEIPTSR